MASFSPSSTASATSTAASADDTLTVAQILSHHADLQCPPSRSCLRALAKYATCTEEKEKLEWLGSFNKLAQQEYNDFIVNERRNIMDVLNCFPSISTIPIDDLVDLMPAMNNRFYSICSSSLVSPSTVDIVARVVEYNTPTGRHHRGVCTRFLLEREEGDQVPIFIKQSLFRLPPLASACAPAASACTPSSVQQPYQSDPSQPIIMFAAGTGVAPFRAFIQERMYQHKQGAKVAKTVLFVGYEHPQQDFLFSEEFEEARAAGVLTLFPAFSHHHQFRNYVYHKMLQAESVECIWSLIEQGAYLYVCGSAKTLAPCVFEALTQIVMQKTGKTEEDAQIWLKQMQEKHRYQLDVF